MSSGSADKNLEAEILAYLSEHPNAADSLTGIAEWWIERQRALVGVEAVRRAVGHLVECGSLETFGDAGDPFYRLSRKSFRRTLH